MGEHCVGAAIYEVGTLPKPGKEGVIKDIVWRHKYVLHPMQGPNIAGGREPHLYSLDQYIPPVFVP